MTNPQDFQSILNRAQFTRPVDFDKQPPETPEEKARRQYAALDALVVKTLAEAKAMGKQPVILLGENHQDNANMMTELMMLDIATKRGIKTFAIEAEKNELDFARLSQRMRLEDPHHLPETVAHADRLGMTVIATDMAFTGKLTPEINTQREQHMLISLSQVDEPVIMVTGAAHLRGLMAKQAQWDPGKLYTAVDISNLSAEDLVHMDMRQFMVEEIIEMRRDKTITHSVIGPEAREMGKHQALEIAAGVTGDASINQLAPQAPAIPKAPTSVIDSRQRQFDQLTKLSTRAMTPGLFYQEQQESYVRTHNLGDITRTLDQDPALLKSYEQSSVLYERLFTLPIDSAEYTTLSNQVQETNKEREAMIRQKATALGVTEEKAFEAVSAVFRFHQQDAEIVQRHARERKVHEEYTQSPAMRKLSQDIERDGPVRNAYEMYMQSHQRLMSNYDARQPEAVALRESLQQFNESAKKDFEQSFRERVQRAGVTDPVAVDDLLDVFRATRLREERGKNIKEGITKNAEKTVNLLEDAKLIYGTEAADNPVIKEFAAGVEAQKKGDMKSAAEFLEQAAELLPAHPPQDKRDVEKLQESLMSVATIQMIQQDVTGKNREMDSGVNAPGYAPDPVPLDEVNRPKTSPAQMGGSPRKASPKGKN